MNAIAESNGVREETAARWKLLDEFPAGKWSGQSVPEIGAIIKAKVNNIGLCRVLGYYVECGWVGVVVKPLDPPEWFVRQNGDKYDGTCGVFGAEIEQGEETMTVDAEAAKELETLTKAVVECPGYKYLRWESLTRELERRDFPYTLVQSNRNDIGQYSRKNLYYWKSRSFEKGALYVNETEAGRKMVTGVRNAVEVLRRVLLEAAGMAEKGGAA